MVLNRDSLLDAMKLKTQTVTLDDGSEVLVSELAALDYIKLWTDPANQKKTGEKVLKDGKEEEVSVIDIDKFSLALVAYSAVDENGARLFSDEDVPLIARSNQSVFFKLAEAAREVNGFKGNEAKNFDTTTTDDSSTVSA